MFAGNFTARRVDDEIDVTILDPIEHVRASFVDLEYLGDFDFCLSQRFCRPAGRNNFKTEFEKFASDGNDCFLIGVFDADKDSSAFR